MKIFLSIFSIMVLGTAFLACDFGSDDEDSSGTPEDDAYYSYDDTYYEDDTGGGGLENDWELVMIVDAEENTSGGECNDGNPGADIDAVELFRDGTVYGWVQSVEALEEVFVTPCDVNDKDDPEEMLGQEDGVASAEEGFSGYFSLNGRTAYLLMSDLMEDGDSLVIYEMYNELNPDATIETYQVYLGYYTDDGDMAFTNEAFSDWNTGRVEGVINGLW